MNAMFSFLEKNVLQSLFIYA